MKKYWIANGINSIYIVRCEILLIYCVTAYFESRLIVEVFWDRFSTNIFFLH